MGDRDWAGKLISPGDEDLESLAFTTFHDSDDRFKLGAGDQALASAAFSYLHRRDPGSEVLVLAVPRGAHDVALCVALAAQFTQLRRLGSPITRHFCPWEGSIAVIGHNTAVQTRLGQLQIRGTHLHGGVANALRAYRVRKDGRIAGTDGVVHQHDGGPGRLLYLNTRINPLPALTSERDPLVVIDTTRIGSRENIGRALVWADDHGTRHVIVIAHLGDGTPYQALKGADRSHFTFDLAAEIRQDLVHELGHGHGDALPSSNELLRLPPPTLRIRVCGDEELSQSLFLGRCTLINAPGHQGQWPYAVGRAHRLLTGLRTLVDDVNSYNGAAALDPWIRDLGSAASQVERTSELPRVRRRWRLFATAHWGTVRQAVLDAYRRVESGNPKLEALVDEVERALREPHRRVLIRTADRAAARSLPSTLRERLGDRYDDARVDVVRSRVSRPWLPADAAPVTEILPAAPPVWDSTWLFTGESTDRVVLAYPFEVRWLQKTLDRAQVDINERRAAFFTRFHLGTPPLTDVQVTMPTTPPPPRNEAITLDAGDLWQKLLDLDAPAEQGASDSTAIVRHWSREVRGPVVQLVTDDGRTHEVPVGEEVEVFVAGKYRIRLAEELQAGDTFLYTTGSGRESLFARLVTASYRSLQVDDFDVVMRRFRNACRRIRQDAGSWAEGNRRIRDAGASAETQLQAWATGDTIAPAHAGDVRVVAQVAGDAHLEENWFRIEKLASELRVLHQRLGRALSAAIAEAIDGGGPNVRRVTALVGVDAEEILDEFTTATVVEVRIP